MILQRMRGCCTYQNGMIRYYLAIQVQTTYCIHRDIHTRERNFTQHHTSPLWCLQCPLVLICSIYVPSTYYYMVHICSLIRAYVCVCVCRYEEARVVVVVVVDGWWCSGKRVRNPPKTNLQSALGTSVHHNSTTAYYKILTSHHMWHITKCEFLT